MKKRKNFHYHYAEKFETRDRRKARSGRKGRLAVPVIPLVVSVFFLLIFGLVSTTFSVYVTTSAEDLPSSGGLLVTMRNKAVREDTDSYGITQKGDADLASTGTTTSMTVYYRNNHNWSNVYILTSSNITMDSDTNGWKNVYGSSIKSCQQMSLVTGETNVYKATINVTDGKVVFVSSASDNDGYLNNAGNCVARADYSSGKIVNAWSNNNDKLVYQNSTQYWKSNIEDYTPPETTYAVNVQSENTSKGTVASSSVNAGASTAVTLPTATPAYGYKFKNWTASGGGVSITNPNSASAATITATGTGGTVTAHFEIDDGMNLYIAGRFHVQTTDSSNVWTNSFDSGDWSNTGDDNIKFTWDSGSQKYKVETHASLENLSGKISNLDPWFYVYDKGNNKYWYRTTANTYLNLTTTSTTLTKYDSNQGDQQNAKLRFNANERDKPVTLWFNPLSGTLSYSVYPDFHSVTVSSITNGTVTADLSRASAGETVTLTVTPNSGGYVTNWVKYSYNGSTYTITPENDVYSFTMPNYDVTVTANFSQVPIITSFTIDGQSSATKEIGQTATLASTKDHSSDSVTYEVTSNSPTGGGNDPVVVLSGTGNRTVTALRPGTATITASLTGAESKTVTVTVNSPTLSSSVSIEEMRNGTLSVNSSSVTPSTYSWAVKSGSESKITLGTNTTSSTVAVESISYYDGNGSNSAYVTLTAGYTVSVGGNSYTYSKSFDAAVTITQSPVKFGSALLNITDRVTAYNKAASTTYGKDFYVAELYLEANQTVDFYFKVGNDTYKDQNEGTITKDSTNCWVSTLTTQSPNGGWDLVVNNNMQNCRITADKEGTYCFYFIKESHKLFVSDFPDIEYHLIGLGNWNKNSDNLMTETSSGSGVYTWTKTCTAAEDHTYTSNDGFKVFCNDGSKYFGYDDTFDHGNQTDQLSDTAGNAAFKAWYAGTYTFSFNSNTDILTITGPTRTVTLTANLPNNTSATVNLANPSNDYFTLTDNDNDTFSVTVKDTSASYEFYQWTNHSPSNEKSFSITLNTTNTSAALTSTWRYKGYDVILYTNAEGATISDNRFVQDSSDHTKYLGSMAHHYNSVTSLPTPTATAAQAAAGYTFDGWYRDNTSTQAQDWDDGPYTTIDANDNSGNYTYRARWVVNVEFKDNINDRRIAYFKVEVGSDITSQLTTLRASTNTDTTLSAAGFTFSNYDRATNNIVAEQTIYAIYKPDAKDFTVTITASGNGVSGGNGSAWKNRFIINYGAKISVRAEITKQQSLNSNIHYKFIAYRNDTQLDLNYDHDTTYDSATGKYIYENQNIVPLLTKSSNGTYMLKAKAYFTDARGQEVYTSDGSESSYTIYYEILSPTLSIASSPLQKIYSTVQGATDPSIELTITAYSTITQANDYVNLIQTYFKSDLFTYNKLSSATDKYDELVDRLAITGNGPTFTSTYTDVPVGVNYYKFKIRRLTEQSLDDPTNNPQYEYDAAAVQSPFRTVVGSAQSYAARPIYIANNSVTSFSSGKRVMLFYINDHGELGYATSTSFSHSGTYTESDVYRFDIPAEVDQISIGVFDTSKEYVLPELDGTSVVYTNTNFFVYTGWIDITSTTQKVNISGGVSQGNAISSSNISIVDKLS